MKNVNDYEGNTDNEQIEAAIVDRRGDAVVIPPRRSKRSPERDWWLLDRAVTLPGNTTVILENCRIKLSDSCRDNFFRSANCGFGIVAPEQISDIHIRGVGNVVLEGADHPRSTGDASKILGCPCPKNFTGAEHPTFEDLHRHSYGTDAGNPQEFQSGDWRNIGILMANVDRLSIENLKIVEPHAWAISLESCSSAEVRQIEFRARMTRHIDGADHNNENQDGINLRAGCHDVLITDISGTTGDDVIALTAIVSPEKHAGGQLGYTQIMPNDFSKREKDIRNVIIRNVLAYPAGGCKILRLLALGGAEIHNVSVDGIVDTSPDEFHTRTTVELGAAPGIMGEPNHPYGEQSEQSIFDVAFSNIISNADRVFHIPGGLQKAVFCNIVNRNPNGKGLVIKVPDLLKDVQTFNISASRTDEETK